MNSSQENNRPTILVFDSGIGGLSVYSEIRQLLPDLHYIYAFDNKGFPYGDKPDHIIVERVCTFIEKITQQYSIDLAVIACNTASTISLPALREEFSFPIVGVVPAIKPAIQLTKNKHVGLLATKATVERSYTSELIKQFATDSQVELLGLSELALIAEDKLHGQPVDIEQLKLLLTPWLTLSEKPDVIVLGCTHYPFLKPELQMLFPESKLIDSGQAIASRVAFLLKDKILLPLNKNQIKDKNIAIYSYHDTKVEKLYATLSEYNFDEYQEIRF